MGDVALSSTVFEDIANAYPDAEIDLNTLAPCDRLFVEDPRFANIYTFDVRAARGRWKQMWRWLKTMYRRRYDLIVDLQTTDRSRLLIALLMLSGRGAPVRLGNDAGFPYTSGAVLENEAAHALEIMRGNVNSGGIACNTERPVLHPGQAAVDRADALIKSNGLVSGDFAIMLPGCQAGGYLKRWGTAHYSALAHQLIANGMSHVVLLGGPDEVRECEQIASQVGTGLVNLCGKTQLPDIAPFAAHARFIVANDTGTAHLAAAADRPMLIICGPTDPRRVRPAGTKVVTMQAELPCINCYRKHCGHHSCMRLISPESVYERVSDPVFQGDIPNQGGTSEREGPRARRRSSDGPVV